MKRRHVLGIAVPALLLLAASAVLAQKAERYSSLRVDGAGQMHILTDTGREITPARMKSQVSFGAPAISPDGLTVGWKVEYDNSDALGVPYDPTASDLVLFRNGRIVLRFHAEQMLWDWKFVEDGKRLAYTEGPLHGNPTACVLRDTQSGRVIERWFFDENAEFPAWAAGIRCKGE